MSTKNLCPFVMVGFKGRALNRAIGINADNRRLSLDMMICTPIFTGVLSFVCVVHFIALYQ